MSLWWVAAAAAAAVLAAACPTVGLACGGTFMAASGTITSPGYPGKYPHNTDCVYMILAGGDARIKLSCPEIHLQDSHGCQSDSLSINGLHVCGNTKLNEVYGQGTVILRFTSDGSVSKKRGFKCTYVRVSGGETRESPQRSDYVTSLPRVGACTFNCVADYNYDEVLHKSLLFYEAQRSGFLPSSQRVTWRRDSATDDAYDAYTKKKVDLEGGYYDAGDYMKFGFPMASSATVLAWGAVEYAAAYKAAGEMSNVRAAVKWATDYFIKAHVNTTTFYGQVGNGIISNDYWGRPEDMTKMTNPRPAFKINETNPGSDLAGETAAALAAASILFKDSDSIYSTTCLSHARLLYDFAKDFPGKYSDSIVNATEFYNSGKSYYDELAWASMWLYRATGEVEYLSQAKTHYEKIDRYDVVEFSWAEKTPGVMVLLAQLADTSEKPIYKQHLEFFCDNMNKKPKTPKGLVFIGKWGSLRYAANVAFVCLRAADLGIKSETYIKFGRQQIHYMLGSTGRSFVVGYGKNPPERPHHASSSCKDKPASCDWDALKSSEPNPHVLYGALVGGPDEEDNYKDNRSDAVKNEVACDYNAGFQSAVAALRHLYGCGTTDTLKSASSVRNAPPAVKPTSPTTQTSLETTVAAETTAADIAFNNCASVFQYFDWKGAFQADLVVIIPYPTKFWFITLTFSSVVSRFVAVNADPSTTPSTTITLTNKPFNGWQAAGNTLTINFIVIYRGTKPEVTSVIYNGTPLCLN